MTNEVIVAVAALVAAYVLVLYPLLLRWLARHYGQPVRKAPGSRSVSVVIAVRNGAPFMEAKLRSVLALDYPPELLEIIVVSDGSDDGTDKLAARFEGVQVIRVPRGGKCAALNAGIARARHEILLLTDVRQDLEPHSLRTLVDCFADERVGVVSGTLMIRRGATQDAIDVGVYWRFETWMREQLSALDSMMGATGPFYAMRRELAVNLPTDCLLDDMYLPLAAFFRGFRLVSEPQAIAYDYPTSLQSEFKRKVRTLAGNYQLLRYYPQLLLPANRMWLHYVSYKLGRLLLPYVLIVLFAASALLAWPYSGLLVSGQAVFYLLAVLDRIVPEGSFPKRVTSPVRAFVTMMMAAVCATSILFVPPRTLWKETQVQKVS